MQRDPVPLQAEPVYAEPVYHYDPGPQLQSFDLGDSVEEIEEETTGGEIGDRPKAKSRPRPQPVRSGAYDPTDPYHQVKSQGKVVRAQSEKLDAINEDLTEIKEAIRHRKDQKVAEVEEREL